MKKLISILVSAMLILSTLALAACGGGSSSKSADLSDSKYVGTWKGLDMSMGDAKEEIEGEWILTLNKDGTGTLSSGEDSSDFKWELTKDGFKTTGDLKTTFKDAGDNIETSIIGVKLTFEKQE